MSRQPLPLGTWGEIRVYVAQTSAAGKATKYRAVTNFRDYDGVTRRVERYGSSKTAATTQLKTALNDRSRHSRTGQLNTLSTFTKAAELWLEKLDEKVNEGTRSPGTRDTYHSTLHLRVLPVLGNLRLGEVDVPAVDRLISSVRKHVGPSSARLCKTVISNVLSLAARLGAIKTNPTREIDRIEGKPKKEPRALNSEERRSWFSQLLSDPDAVRKDLPDLFAFMLATGMRIGEVLAVHVEDVNLDDGTVHAGHIISRVKGKGLVRRKSRTKSHERMLSLPSWAIEILRRRIAAEAVPSGPLFPDVLGGYRDPSNTRRDIRLARGTGELSWVTSHSFRKTNATLIDEAGLSARDAADQLGHANVSMTQDVYFGRKVASSKVARALEGAFASNTKTEKCG